MKPTRPLQDLLDPFVRSLGGELIADLLQGAAEKPLQADYLFRASEVVVELKSLERDSFGSSFKEKMAEAAADWHRRGLIVAYGGALLRLRTLPEQCRREMLGILAEPLQRSIFAKANDQIKSTKDTLGLYSAKGVVWVASDGNVDLQPDLVWYLLQKIFAKKKQDGTFMFSGIQAVVYFHPRMAAKAQDNQHVAVWAAAMREHDPSLMQFLESLQAAWLRFSLGHSEAIATAPAPSPSPTPTSLAGLRFVEAPTKPPFVVMNDPDKPPKTTKK